MQITKEKVLTFIALHGMLLIFSISSVFSKMAGNQPFLSFKFILYYGIVLMIMVFYAVCWQQILKRLPLVTAYANKAVTVIWGLIWGFLFFQEEITIKKICGAAIIIMGVMLVVSADKEETA